MSEKFVDAVEAIYRAAPEPSLWPSALQAIADCFDDVGAVLLWHRGDGAFGVIASPGLAEAQRDYVENGWTTRDTRSIRAVEQAYWVRGDSIADHNVITEQEMAVDPFYRDFLASHGLKWCVAVGVSPDPQVAAAVSVQRSAGKPAYADGEAEMLGRLGRHVESALRLSLRLLDAELIKVSLGEALDRVSFGVFVLDGTARVVFSNQAARRLEQAGLAVADDRLLASPLSQQKMLRDAIDAMLRAESSDLAQPPKPLLLRRENGDRTLVVYVLPMAQVESAGQAFLTQARAIVLAIDPEAGAPADPSVVRDIFGLTLAEARVAALVGHGMAPRGAADKLGITEETARSVLKRVFNKVGVSRQSELSTLLNRLALK